MSAPASKFPLTWPAGWHRTPAGRRKRGKFNMQSAPGFVGSKVSFAEGVSRVLVALKRMGVVESLVIISSNLRVGRHGLPLSDQAQPDDPGIAVYWTGAGGAKAMACDLYDRAPDNLSAIAATLEAMRAIERHGGAQILNRVFTGFEALPAPRSHWEILHILPTRDRDTIERAYRIRAMKCHPDHGGTAAAFDELTKARAAALEALS